MSSTPLGLIGCGSDWGNAFCITKTIEVAFSLSLIIWIIYEMVNYYHYVRVVKSSFILIVQILMLLSLTFNIAYSVYHTTYALLYLQNFFYNMYFVILFYYLIYNVFKRIKLLRTIIGCVVGVLAIIFILVLIDSFITNVQMCKQLSYMVMSCVGLFISIAMFIAYRYNEVKQKKRIQKLNKMIESDSIDFKQQQNQQLIKIRIPSRIDFNQPFKKIWVLIICNLLCQIIDVGQSLAFQLDWDNGSKDNCPISQNPNINSSVNFIFVIFSLYMGFIATIYVFRLKRQAKDQFQARIKSPSDFSSVASNKGLLQMIGKQNFSVMHDHSSLGADNLSDLYDRQRSFRKQFQ